MSSTSREDAKREDAHGGREDRCGSGGRSLSLPVLSSSVRGEAHPIPQGGSPIRKSRNAWKRAVVLGVIQVLIIAHVVQWWLMGTTVAPFEPSEAMETLKYGVVTVGFIFFALALASTAILGRWFCGWGCHVVMLQDLCDLTWPGWSIQLTTEDFWRTFPGVAVAVPFLFICGFACVYFLGAKGYCTYGCPYGGFFAPLDEVAPGRIRVTDACEHCGHCTAVCTSNVRVHEEVRDFGMVVDPGCMKCMDCVSVCPNDALYFGFGAPAVRKDAVRRSEGSVASAGTGPIEITPPAKASRAYDLSWPEELVLSAI
ncbi:MAG: 4Fe-4S binding protein, partial [Phycisphaerales bacterium]